MKLFLRTHLSLFSSPSLLIRNISWVLLFCTRAPLGPNPDFPSSGRVPCLRLTLHFFYHHNSFRLLSLRSPHYDHLIVKWTIMCYSCILKVDRVLTQGMTLIVKVQWHWQAIEGDVSWWNYLNVAHILNQRIYCKF